MRRVLAVGVASAVAVSLAGAPGAASGPSGTTTTLLPAGGWTGQLGAAVIGQDHVYALEDESPGTFTARVWAGEIEVTPTGTELGVAAVVAHADEISGLVEDAGVLAYRRPVDHRVVLRDASGVETLPDWGATDVLPDGVLLEMDGDWLVTWNSVVHMPTGTVTPLDVLMGAREGRWVSTARAHVEGDLLLWHGRVDENRATTWQVRAVRLGRVAPEGPGTLLDSTGPRGYDDTSTSEAGLAIAGIAAGRVVWTRSEGDFSRPTTQVRWVPTTDLGVAPRTLSSPTRGGTSGTGPFVHGSRVVLVTGDVNGTAITELDLANPAAAAKVEAYGTTGIFAGRDSFVVTREYPSGVMTLRDRAGRPFRQVAGHPLVTSVAPSTGGLAGGGEVVVRGSGFSGTTSVTFGGIPATAVRAVSDTELRVSPPPGNWPGTVPVVVTTVVGASGVAATGGGLSGVSATSSYTYASFVAQRPQRVLAATAVPPETTRCVQVAGRAGVPSTATGVTLTVTTVRPTSYGHVVVYPDSDGTGATPPPSGSTVGFEPGTDVANTAFVDLAANGRVCYLTRGAASVGLLLDVTGWSSDEAGVETQAAERLVDTRPGSLHVGELEGPLQPRERTTVQVTGHAGVPHGASAVLANITVVKPARAGNLRVASADVYGTIETSTVNYAVGQDKANAAVVPLSTDGKIVLWSDSAAPVHVVVDVVGFTRDDTDWRQTHPRRVLDTRPGPGFVYPSSGLEPRTPEYVSLRGKVPDDATAAVLNVTSIHPEAVGNLRVYPDVLGSRNLPPDASTLNYVVGRDVPNLVVVALPPSRQIVLWSDSPRPAHVAVDVVGYLKDS